MIRIEKFAPPANYEREVRRPGLNFLRRNPNPSAIDFSRHSYWKAIHNELYQLYSGICSYCSSWTARNPRPNRDNTSVDHFIPKSIHPNLAYEWTNFRLCRARLNAKKDNSTEVMDPCYIKNGWFQIDFRTFLMNTSSDTPNIIREYVNRSIDILGLNDDDYVNERLEIIRLYALEEITIDELGAKYPFIAEEIRRSNFDIDLKPIMHAYFR